MPTLKEDLNPPLLVGRGRLRDALHALYFGQGPAAVRFRYAILIIDLAIIAFFVAAPLMRGSTAFLAIDYTIATVVIIELVARALAAPSIKPWLKSPIAWIDFFVLGTLLIPQWAFNFGFLRILRLWTLINSEFFWRTVGRRYDDTRWEEVTRTASSMLTFIFVVTGFVYTSYARTHPGINGYIDALYFTIATLTTTGFGDIVLPGAWGKLISIVTMIVGITLFVRIAQGLFRPYKVNFRCTACGLSRHDVDAAHCKACGRLLNIPNDDDA